MWQDRTCLSVVYAIKLWQHVLHQARILSPQRVHRLLPSQQLCTMTHAV